MLFCRDIKIPRNLRTFLNLWAKKCCFFFGKTVSLGQEVHYYMVYIAYCTVLNLQICINSLKRRICGENSKYAFDENVYGHFCPRRKAANFCHPDSKCHLFDRTMKLD